ncbi:MAG: NAD(+) synthase [Christensenellaceae bacterium]|jgi:NAD+ synthase (glutamine-hydrolysing)|nr:NAD(+) synthase [Christensenellaceae bacterium]
MQQFGFIRLAAATPKIRVADTAYNAAAVLAQYREASANGAAIVTFPELCLTGYTCGDLFAQTALQRGAVAGLCTILEGSRDISAIGVIGLPLSVNGALYNCAALVQNGRVLGVVPKQYIPNYGEFYELRHFAPGLSIQANTVELFGEPIPFGADLLFACGDLPELVLGVEICEDLWVPEPPSIRLCQAGATVIANLSASDEVIGKADYRRVLLQSQSGRLFCAYIYCAAGQGESSTDLLFAGHNMLAENGSILAESSLYSQGVLYADADVAMLAHERIRSNTFTAKGGMRRIPFALGARGAALSRAVARHPFIPASDAERAKRCEQIFDIQAHGLAKRVEHTNSRTLIVGISGGLDSCLALLVAVRAMSILSRGPADIIAITMPCFGTTARTRANAEALCRELGVTFRCIPIEKAVLQHFADIGQSAEVHDVTYENVQARERTQVLMDIANMEGGLVVGTGDLSELALGWATYNGDHMSMYAVNMGVPKTLVRHVVGYAASVAASAGLRAVLQDILNTPVSPELLPAAPDDSISQVTEDLVGPYELHDFFLYYLVRHGFAPRKLYMLACHAFAGAYENAVILKWLKVFIRRFFAQQFKRSCLPDGPKVGSVALSPRGDWRMPSDASAALWLEELEEL